MNYEMIDKVENVVDKILCENCPDPELRDEDCDDCQMFLNFRDMLLKGVNLDDE